ncbi:DUF2975 domain-containing protein [Cellulophaga sp. Hel_I_12]|uniref:DUF2975 domain-containing protein n=1 Tax=Cellulophaga sp. Hel_I_12 TaxID=1249972 RepID=UPI0006469A78|nr:DUF2975 domain-containing protein [Cellulophaga sp. Hel_I_12]
MTKNKLLNIVIIICKLLQFIYIVTVVALTAFFLHFQIDKTFYSDVNINFNTTEFQYTTLSTWTIDSLENSDENQYSLDKISTFSLYLIYLQYIGVLIILFLIAKEFRKVIQSVKNLNTFRDDNIKSFRKIGRYIFLYFLLTSFYFIHFETASFGGFKVSFTPLALMGFAFLMAEIFKEGNSLMLENDLTI